MHPLVVLAFILLAAVAATQVSSLASRPGGHVEEIARVAAPQAAAVATPNHDPRRVRTAQAGIAEPGATPNRAPQTVSVAQAPAAEAVATPNHDPRRLRPALALNPLTLQAPPEPAAPAAMVFVDADTTVYAKGGARLRAAPSTMADVVTKLAADAPLRTTARSRDGAWWRVALDSGQTGYVHRAAVTRNRAVAAKSQPAATPVVAVAAPQRAPAHRSQGLLGYVNETMNWLADTAGRGSPPKAIRPER